MVNIIIQGLIGIWKMLTLVIQWDASRVVPLIETAPLQFLDPDIGADSVHNQIQLTIKHNNLHCIEVKIT